MAESIVLHPSGDRMPLVGFGTWKVPRNICAQTVATALQLGLRLLDCACDYGNEVEVGAGIRAALAANPSLKREDIFVTSKLWNTYHAKENVRAACERTLADLGLKYLDLYLIHFPISLKFVPFEHRYPPEWKHEPTDSGLTFEPVTFRETWEAMEELVHAGLVRNIGVANVNCSTVMDLLKYAKVHPAVNQIEVHPYLTQETLVKFCQNNKIAITAYSSFGGLSYIPLNFESAISCPSLLEADVVVATAKKHNKTTAQVLLRWAIERNMAVIPKSNSPERIRENFELLDFSLTAEEMTSISSLNKNLRFNNPGVYFNWPIFD